MIFRKAKLEDAETPPSTSSGMPELLLVGGDSVLADEGFLVAVAGKAGSLELKSLTPSAITPAAFRNAAVVLSVFLEPADVDRLLDAVVAQRKTRSDGYPVLIIATHIHKLTSLGHWLYQAASQERLQGIRLITTDDHHVIVEQLAGKFEAINEPNVIKMPVSPETDCKDFKYFFSITPDQRMLIRTMKELAENGITRVYLLGGPGAGKTSVAYYYYLCRGKGNFVTVNLTAESTGDKESMKSLICGHVTGALGGNGGAREGALSHAADGVAFLDESHGVTGVVMQVLMEVLDSGQYLPFGAVKKRALECAVIFASNRSWEALRDMMNLDEHARLGATIVRLTDLAVREEDMIAVLATTLARFSKQCTSWKAPEGVSEEAWKVYRECKWHGNTRTLIRVTEAAGISFGLMKSQSPVVDAPEVLRAIDLWEPTEHASLKVYTSFTSAS